MGFFDEQIEQADAADAARAPQEQFEKVYGGGWVKAALSTELAPIIADFLPRVPLGAGSSSWGQRALLWTTEPGGGDYYFVEPMAPPRPSIFDMSASTRRSWRDHEERIVRIRASSRSARLLEISLGGDFDSGMYSAFFARRSDGPWAAVRPTRLSPGTNYTMWGLTDRLDQVTGPLTKWLREFR